MFTMMFNLMIWLMAMNLARMFLIRMFFWTDDEGHDDRDDGDDHEIGFEGPAMIIEPFAHHILVTVRNVNVF